MFVDSVSAFGANFRWDTTDSQCYAERDEDHVIQVSKDRNGSGIRSIGLAAYPTTTATTTFACHGMRGSRYARYSAYTSSLRFLAQSFNLSMGLKLALHPRWWPLQ